MIRGLSLLLLSSAALFASAAEYKPVIILHGITGSASEYDQMVSDFAERGQTAYSLPVFEGSPNSWVQLNYQVEHIAEAIRAHVAREPDAYADGYHLVCHSQGALICRCLTEYMSDHNIDTLVSMAGPQMGVYDEAFFFFFKRDKIQELTLDEIYHLADSSLMQSTLSVANMWSDPYHYEEFLADNKFLPKYNNLIDHEESEEFKKNFLALNKAAFLVGNIGVEYDGGIGPWQSAIFKYYDADGNFVPMESSQIYTEDTFGLKSMDERGDLTIKVVEGVSHNEWFNNAEVYKKHIFPLVE